jgi:hypothetical protein
MTKMSKVDASGTVAENSNAAPDSKDAGHEGKDVCESFWDIVTY